jgi:hypothetical protein
MITMKRFAVVAVVAVFAVAAMGARKAPTAPGKYEGWGPDIDSLEIVKTFRTADYARVVVQPLDVSSTPRPEEKDMADKFDRASRRATESFLKGLRKNVPDAAMADAQPGASRVLIVRGKVTLLEPGSRAKRMWIGYGAGSSRGAISGEIVDGQTGEVLARFTQERRSAFDHLAGYEEIMVRNVVAIGEDVGNLLKEF